MALKQHNVERRRQEVYKLCMLQHQNPQEVADLMNISTRTIRSDISTINKSLAKQLIKHGQEQHLAEVIEAHRAQQGRLFRYMAGDIPDTARAKYESILLDNYSKLIKYVDKLASMATKSASRTLEDDLAEMSFHRWNEVVGLPLHPKTLLPMALTQAQMRVFEAIPPREPVFLQIVKSRQIGLSELMLRALAYYSFSKYRGKKIAIVAGTRIDTSIQLFNRFCAFFKNINDVVKEVTSTELFLKNGTSVHVTPTSKAALNGWEKFSAFLLDEAAFWDLNDDSVVLDMVLPPARSSGADLFLVSNPNGVRGMHWHVWNADNEIEWRKMSIDFREGAKGMYKDSEVEKILKSETEDVDSQYLCKFVSSKDSIFGDLTPEDISKIYKETPL